jgi:hypothetical protein
MRPIVAVADTHFSHANPQHRTDDYCAVQLSKFRFILEVARYNRAALVIAGDIFDKKDAPVRLVNSIMMLLSEYQEVEVYVVFGNHDSYFHSVEGRERTQLGTLLLSEKVTLIDKALNIGDNTWLYGRSWGEEYPKPVKFGTQILVAHVPVTENVPPPWMTGAVCADEMLEKHPGFDYIITGDWHEAFSKTVGLNTLINCGPMCRMEIGKKDFQPVCWLISDSGFHSIGIPILHGVFAEDVIQLKLDSGLLKRFEDSMKFTESKPTFRSMVEGLLAAENNEKVNQMAKEIFDAI